MENTYKDTIVLVKKNIKQLKQQILNHPCCLDLKECNLYYLAYCPEGFYVDGVRIPKDMGKQKALKLLLEKLEGVWDNDKL